MLIVRLKYSYAPKATFWMWTAACALNWTPGSSCWCASEIRGEDVLFEAQLEGGLVSIVVYTSLLSIEATED
jgi:hypothetical protein